MTMMPQTDLETLAEEWADCEAELLREDYSGALAAIWPGWF